MRKTGAWPAARTWSRWTRRADSIWPGVIAPCACSATVSSTGPHVANHSAVFAARWASSNVDLVAPTSERRSIAAASTPSIAPSAAAPEVVGSGPGAGAPAVASGR